MYNRTIIVFKMSIWWYLAGFLSGLCKFKCWRLKTGYAWGLFYTYVLIFVVEQHSSFWAVLHTHFLGVSSNGISNRAPSVTTASSFCMRASTCCISFRMNLHVKWTLSLAWRQPTPHSYWASCGVHGRTMPAASSSSSRSRQCFRKQLNISTVFILLCVITIWLGNVSVNTTRKIYFKYKFLYTPIFLYVVIFHHNTRHNFLQFL
jgi:hypothetical protein